MEDRFIFAIRISLGLVFLLSGVSKFYDLHAFYVAIRDFGILPDSFIGAFVVLIPLLELLSGLFLLIGIRIKFSSAVAAGLLIIFIDAIIPNLAIDSVIDCGCFGPLVESKVGFGLLIRDFILLGLSLVLYAQITHRWALDNLINRKGE